MNNHILTFRIILFLFILQAMPVKAQTTLPKPDHIVIAILENHGLSQIIGSKSAPYINALANDTLSAFFTESYAITHPSQPNYLLLYSGSTQGVTDDLVPSGIPYTTDNLGRQLLDSGMTFITYSEDLPRVGYNGELSGGYARRHNPVTNWMGNGKNQVPVTTNKPLTTFPSDNFSQLPTVSFVIPNTSNDMHDGTDPGKIAAGDKWISNKLDSYIKWSKANNSLFILTFDEDDDFYYNHITTIFTGKMILAGQYPAKINHYSILHTIEKFYGLPVIGDSINYLPITYCWKAISSIGLPVLRDSTTCLIYPNPVKSYLTIQLSGYQGATAEMYNVNGRLLQVNPLVSKETELKTDDLGSGIYVLKIRSKDGVFIKKFIKN